MDPDTRTIAAYVLQNGQYIATAYGDTGEADIHVLDGCKINLADMFTE